jgi:hypothetical protein
MAAWRTGLFEPSESLTYVYAAICPCVLVHSLYVATTHHSHASADTCYTGALSLLVCAPGCLCLDQCTTRALDKIGNAYEDDTTQAHDKHSGPLDYILRLGHFGDRYAPRWAHDGEGWDLSPQASEDWWPASWCGHYLCALGQAACVGRAVGGNAPRMPLCFSCMLGLCYPLMLCPITFLLRRVLVDQARIDESLPVSCAAAAVCTPCALVQMTRETETNDGHELMGSLPMLTNSMMA